MPVSLHLSSISWITFGTNSIQQKIQHVSVSGKEIILDCYLKTNMHD